MDRATERGSTKMQLLDFTTCNIAPRKKAYKDGDIVPPGSDAIYETRVLYRDGEDLYVGKFLGEPELSSTPDAEYYVDFDRVQSRKIPLDVVRPRFDPSTMTEAPHPLPPGCYVKHSGLLQYGVRSKDFSNFREWMIREIRFCEVLKNAPHPNLPVYYGCVVKEGAVEGLCFKKYGESVLDIDMRMGKLQNKDRLVEDVRRAVHHIHSLGYVHNDVLSSNVLLDENGAGVLIDFDATCRIGEAFGSKRGRHTSPAMEVASTENDMIGISKLCEYLEHL